MEVRLLKSKYLFGYMDQNTYLILSKKEAILIDAGAEVEDIKNALDGRKLELVLMTHLHFDHIWNLDKIIKEFDCPVYIVRGAEEMLTDSSLNASFLIGQNITKSIDKSHIKYYENEIKTTNFDIKVIFTPGHSKDSVCLLVGDILFSGDTLFAGTTGRTDLAGGSETELNESLKKLEKINYLTLCPGHGETLSK